jgi:hypothetical protein
MARSKNVSRKAGGGHVSAGEDTPGRYEPPVLTQEVEALVAEAAAKADHAAQLRSVVEEGSDDDLQLSPDEDEEEDEDAAVVVSSRPNARKKRPRKDKASGLQGPVVVVMVATQNTGVRVSASSFRN